MSKLGTQNLELRVRTLADADALFALYSDPKVVEFLSGVGQDRDSVVKSVFISDSHWRKNGFGMWSIYLKKNNDFIGSVGLRRDASAQVDLTVHIAKKYWRNGFAFESCGAVMDFGFRLFKLNSIAAMANKKHAAAVKLLEKLGFREIRSEPNDTVLFQKEPTV